MHNEGCRTAKYTDRRPAEPLHPVVFEECLALLKGGCSLTTIQEQNATKFEARSYTGMPKTREGLTKISHRWNLLPTDTRSLYRQFNRLEGINVTRAPHINIDQWLNPESPTFHQVLFDAVFHYAPRASRDERFEICIATNEMKEAAWEIAHRFITLLDGTFGVCSAKLLLFILMGIDKRNRGIPLAFLLFSAPSNNKTTSSGYDHEILRKLLESWKCSLGTRNGESFAPAVIITDTDAKERKAGAIVFPQTSFLLCGFHVRQSWKNHLARVLKGESTTHRDLRVQIRAVEDMLFASESYNEAVESVKKKIDALKSIVGPDEGIIQNAISHLEYFVSYWLGTEEMWAGFSQRGRQAVADRIGCPVSTIPTTTNHLESFNGVLKGKYIKGWKKSGRRLRADLLISVLVTKIAPAIFQKKRVHDEAEEISKEKMRSLKGGHRLVENSREQTARAKAKKGKRANVQTAVLRPVLFFSPDETRTASAMELFTTQQISAPALRNDNSGLTFTCYSSSSLVGEANPLTYHISLNFDGSGGCDCHDFSNRGGACKHIRAALMKCDQLRSTTVPGLPLLSLPTTEEEARARQKTGCDGDQETIAPEPAPLQLDPLEEVLQAARDTIQQSEDARFTTDGLDGGDEFDQDDEHLGSEQDFSPDSSDDEEDQLEPEAHSTPAALQIAEQTRRTVDDQSLLRVITELERDSPKFALHSSNLSGITMREDFRERVEKVRGSLLDVVKGLDKLLGGVEVVRERTTTSTSASGDLAQPRDQLPPLSPLATQNRGWKRTKVDYSSTILAPSPEKTSSKRKQSYSIY